MDFQVATALGNKQADEDQGIQARVHVTSYSTADDDEGTVAADVGGKPKMGKRGVATPARVATGAGMIDPSTPPVSAKRQTQSRPLRGSAAADAALKYLLPGGGAGVSALGSGTASPSLPAFGRLTSAASVIDVAGSERGCTPAGRGEESIEIQRVLQGAKLGRELRAAIANYK